MCIQLNTVTVDKPRTHAQCPKRQMNANELNCDFIHRWYHHNKHDPMFRDSAEINKSVVIYHRGIGQARESGFFMMEKVDILLGFVVELGLAVFYAVVALLSIWMWPKRLRSMYRGETLTTKKVGNGDDNEVDSDDDELDKGFQVSTTAMLRSTSTLDCGLIAVARCTLVARL